MKSHIIEALSQSQQMLKQFVQNADNIVNIESAATLLVNTLKQDKRVFSCGNGGSMSDAMHFAEELSGRFRDNRKALSATAISDPGHISCVANDFGYEHIFSRYLEANAKKGDCLLAISTSGTSKNILQAAQYAKEHGVSVITLTGAPLTPLTQFADTDISVGASNYADRVQEIHIKVIHILIELVERQLCTQNYR